MRRFELHRHEDPTGISGTGRIAVGVLFDDAPGEDVAVIRWLTAHRSTVLYHPTPPVSAMAEVDAIHGHNGLTEIRWLDPPEEP
jgi:hypothetical protein